MTELQAEVLQFRHLSCISLLVSKDFVYSFKTCLIPFNAFRLVLAFSPKTRLKMTKKWGNVWVENLGYPPSIYKISVALGMKKQKFPKQLDFLMIPWVSLDTPRTRKESEFYMLR